MKKPNKKTKQSIGVLTFEISSPQAEIHLLPDGDFQADDGRSIIWKMNPGIARKVLAYAHARKRDTVIDYEHQTLRDDKAPASGWFHDLVYREGEGIFITDPRWTETAAAHIEADEYRYISAVFSHHPVTGEVIRILHAGLTNNPGLDGLEEVELLRAAAKFNINTNHEEDKIMNEEQLKALGLDKDASDDEIIAALKAVQTKSDESQEEIAALKSQLKDKTDKDKTPDPAKYVSVEVVEALKSDLTAIQTNLNDDEVEKVVSLGMSDGRIHKTQETWARDLGKSDIAALKSYVETAVPIAALKGGQTDDTDQQNLDADGNLKLNETQIAACKNQGISQEDYLKALNEEQATT